MNAYAKGQPCEAAGPNHPENENKLCRYEEPHNHGGFDCDKTCPCRKSNISMPSKPLAGTDGDDLPDEPVATRHAIIGINTQVSDVWNVLKLSGSDDNSFPLQIFKVEPADTSDPDVADTATSTLTMRNLDVIVGLSMALKAAIEEHLAVVPEEHKQSHIDYVTNLLGWIKD